MIVATLTPQIPSLLQWLWNGTGPLSSNVSSTRNGTNSKGAEIGAFLRSDEVPGTKSEVPSHLVNASGPDAPDLELITCRRHFSYSDVRLTRQHRSITQSKLV
jgi:hypothetical protein